METIQKIKKETTPKHKVLVKVKKMNEMKIKASANVCCTWQNVN